MLRATIKGLLAHKLRLALTALAIVLGVTFVSGTLVLTDTLRKTFTSLFGQIYSGVSFVVRGDTVISGGQGQSSRSPVAEDLVAKIDAVPGVAYAEGGVEGYAQLVAPSGKVIAGSESLGFSWAVHQQLSPLTLVSGSPPTTPKQVVIDLGTAKKYDLRLGETVHVLSQGAPRDFVISGFVKFGSTDSILGASIASFSTPTAQQMFGLPGRYDAIDIVAANGSNLAQVKEAIAAVLPHGVEVVSGQQVANEQESNVNSDLGFFSTALLVFAFIALFVGGFTIFNTFSIIVGQRTRELALLRIVGASRRQLFRSVILEAAIVGLFSALVGLGLGVLTALGLRALLSGFGLTLPAGPLVFESSTVIVALLVGVVVTVVSAIGPAFRAVRIPPIAALSDFQGTSQESSRRRIIAGAIVGVGGVATLFGGLTGHSIQLVGIGAVLVFIGAGMLSPVIARPIASVVGKPMEKMFGITGRLGRENSMRSPRRTAQTASALMVGLALISTMAVFGSSLTKSANDAVDQAISASYIISSSSSGPGQFSPTVATAAAKVAGVVSATPVYVGNFEFQGSTYGLTGISPTNMTSIVILKITAGTGAQALANGEMLIDTTTATSDHLHVGSVVPVKFALTGSSTVKIGGIYNPNPLLGSYLASQDYFRAHFSAALATAVLVQTQGPATTSGEKAITAALTSYPGLTVQTKAQFEKTEAMQINQLLSLVYALLMLAIIIALIGIVNTLLLSVFERTREIGLLRAVGTIRGQIRGMIYSEAVILAVFGALVGLVIGTCLGTAFAWSLRQDGITAISVPIPSLIVFLVLAALAGLLASVWPAWKASRMDVLTAIATD